MAPWESEQTVSQELVLPLLHRQRSFSVAWSQLGGGVQTTRQPA
jgi:hypothetical protein